MEKSIENPEKYNRTLPLPQYREKGNEHQRHGFCKTDAQHQADGGSNAFPAFEMQVKRKIMS